MLRKNIVITTILVLLISFLITGCEYSVRTSIYPENSGSIKIKNQKEVADNKVITLEAIPEKDWEFDHWEGHLSGEKNKVKIVVDSNMIIKGVFRKKRDIDIKVGEIAKNKTAGYDWFSYIPKNLKKDDKAYIYMNLSYNYEKSKVVKYINTDAKNCTAGNKDLAEENNFIILTPFLPRDKEAGLYCVKLRRETMISNAPDYYYRPDLKVNMIIDVLLKELRERGYNISSKVIVEGFSSGGMWANRYTLLQPNRVKVAVIGQSGGWLTMPIKKYKNKELNWPFGFNDYKKLTGNKYQKYEELKSTPMLVFIGSKDTEHTHYADSDDIEYFNIWGKEDPKRLKNQVDYLKKHGYNIEFKLFPGMRHETIGEAEVYPLNFIKNHL